MTETPKYTLLVVDDEAGPRQSLRMVFKSDFDVHTVENGDLAVAFAREHPVHIAILDIRMAGRSGIEVLRGLKEIDPHIEVIMLTAYETLETARQALRLGACDYLSKPFSIATVRESAQRALRLRIISENIANTSVRLRSLTQQLEDTAFREDLARTANEIYAGVLHDINNPLTIISGYVELFERRLEQASYVQGGDLEQLKGDIAVISKQVNTCSAIASRYLRFLRQHRTERQQVSTNQVLTDIEALLRHHPSIKKSQLIIQYMETDAAASINGTAFLQVLLNLTINSFQSSDATQTVRVTAELGRTPLSQQSFAASDQELWLGHEEFHNRPPWVAITIADEGRGIPPAVLPRIFEPYYTTRENAQGTGLGLSIVARIIRSVNGLIRVQTSPGRGTRVTVHIPVSSEAA